MEIQVNVISAKWNFVFPIGYLFEQLTSFACSGTEEEIDLIITGR